jgi:hypothetical protein
MVDVERKISRGTQMTPMQAMDMISKNIARLSGTREDHAILMQAETIVKAALMKSGNVPPVAPAPEVKGVEPVPKAD